MHRSPEYRSWESMKTRCYNVNTTQYCDWGGRGIEVCERWLNSFKNFYQDMGDRPQGKYSLDRINVNGNYEPTNCRWASRTEQARNQRLFSTNTSGTAGIYWCTLRKKWYVRLGVGEKYIDLGTYSNIDDAIKARKAAEEKYWGASV